MKKFFVTSIVFLLLIVTVIAQNNFPPVYEIKSDTALRQNLDSNYWQILEDKEGKLTFADVTKPAVASRFHYYTKKVSRRDFSANGFWLRYALQNTMNVTAKICLGEVTYGYEQSDFYLVHEDGKVTHLVNGVLSPWSKLNGIKEFRVLPIELKPGEKIIIYNRVYFTNHVFTFSLSDYPAGFGSTEKVTHQIYTFSQTGYFNAIHDIFIFGVLAFASFFIFLFFIIIREKVYLYFSLYLFSLGIGRFNINSEMYDVFFREHPYLYSYIYSLIWFFPVFFLTQFIRYLLHTKQHFPKWDKFLGGFNSVYALTFLFSKIIDYTTVFNQLLYDIIWYEAVVLSLSYIVTFFMSVKWFKNNVALTHIVLPLQTAWSICVSISQYEMFQLNITTWLTEHWYGLETILLCSLVISFSWILLNRFGELKKQVIQKELEKEIERSKLIENQKIELEEQVANRTAELKNSLEELKSTQAQLIQSEKMASLGELTAGIAHEIQNPLNFVNNFSEVNDELISELVDEVDKGNTEEVKSIATDIKQNLEKINHHGKRADAIVKGMLQHSRASTGKKESTDINALCDEYLRLSYHGMRAKDKDFNAEIKTDFDESIGKISIIPQDIGRVLLNLFNNAFYACTERSRSVVDERSKAEGERQKALNLTSSTLRLNYEPTVSVQTKKLNDKIEIRVSDNGNGIPQNITDKIFQPFFTTKPTGQGTGLGLSLAYDIITKEHNGTIRVESIQNQGSTFIIQLPV